MTHIDQATELANELATARTQLQEQAEQIRLLEVRHSSSETELNTVRGQRNAEIKRVNELSAEVTELRQRLSAEVTALRQRLDAAKADSSDVRNVFEKFKVRVAEVAGQYAEQHDWCSVVDDALEELGLKRPKYVEYRATLRLEGDLYFTVDVNRCTPDVGWLMTALTGKDEVEWCMLHDLGVDVGGPLNGGVTGVSWEVSDIEPHES